MKFRKKPIVIEATQWHKHGDHPAVFQVPSNHPAWGCEEQAARCGWIQTLEGGHFVLPGDWIITGVKGEFYPCKPDIFAETYEPVDGAMEP